MARRPVLAVLLGSVAPALAVQSTVYTHGEGRFPCIRIPSTLALPFDVMLSFAAARSWTGDVRHVETFQTVCVRCVLRTAGGLTPWSRAELLPKRHASSQPEALLCSRREAFNRSWRFL